MWAAGKVFDYGRSKNTGPRSFESHPQPQPVQEVALGKGESYTIAAGEFIADPQENTEKLGLGFAAYLKAVIKLGPEEGQWAALIRIFELEDRALPIIRPSADDKTQMHLSNQEEKPFVVMSRWALEWIHREAYPPSPPQSIEEARAGWDSRPAGLGEIKLLGEGDELMIGRKDGCFAADEWSSPFISREHAVISISSALEIKITDQSVNGTHIIAPGK